MNVTTFPSTLQEFFDNAWQWAVVEQHEQCYERSPFSETGGRHCLYRDPDGNRCLIGASIPDALYSPSLEGVVVYNLFELLAPHLGHVAAATDSNVMFLRRACGVLQQTHDSYRGSAAQWPEYIRMALTRFASDYDLAIPPVAGAAV